VYHPATRLLTILELLQAHPYLSGEELARRLEVEPRSVRRYILMLQEMGMPVEGTRGPGGGYRLRPGFKLPPLLFTEEEATAVVLGLLGTAWLEVGQSSVAVEGALAKVYRVLPLTGRERLKAISSNLTLFSSQPEIRPEVSFLVGLSEAIAQQQRIALDYRTSSNEVTHRKVEPYGIVGWQGHWYLVGYCLLRLDYRLFRLDCMEQVQFLTETFVKAEGFDYHSYVLEQVTRLRSGWHIEVEFQAELYTVQQRIPAYYGTLSATSTGVLFEYDYDDLLSVGRLLMGVALPFVIHQPPQLRDALRQLAEQMLQIANA
jgi:predicted DNA-binding transcriptional regulator YafY